MADGSALTEASDPSEGEPRIPAPLGRTLLLVSLALVASSWLCWYLKEGGIGPETGTVSGRPSPLVSDWTGRIELFWVKAGDTVKAGDAIAILVDEQLLLQIDRQQREIDELQLALLRAEETLDAQLAKRLSELDAEIVAMKSQAAFVSTGESVSDPHLEELEAQRLDAFHQARQTLGIDRIVEELLRAEAKLEQLRSQPKKITLPASATGTIKRLLRKPGERVVPGTPLLELANQSQPYLVVEMPEPLAKRFALGDEIPLSFPGTEKSMGRVANMHRLEPEEPKDSADASASKPIANVRVEIEPADGSWPELPLQSKVTVRTSDSKALSRRVN